MKKAYLVTGGAGFIGSALVRRLVLEENAVRVFDNDSRGHISPDCMISSVNLSTFAATYATRKPSIKPFTALIAFAT